jgi:DNA polymerase-3 subunit epsilon
MNKLAAEERFEEAAQWRESLGHFVNASFRVHRLRWISTQCEIVAAQPAPDGGWEIHVIRFGRLAAAGIVKPGFDPMPHIDALTATAEFIIPGLDPAPAGVTEEAFDLLRWLEQPDVRLVAVSAPAHMPIHCGGKETLQLSDIRRTVSERLSAVTESGGHGRPVGHNTSLTRISNF